MRKIIWILTILLGFSSCQQSKVYNDFRTMPLVGWHQDSVLTYNANMPDSAGIYDVVIVVRHTDQYPYQNLWLFVNTYASKSSVQQRDTIEATMADNYGRWFGRGIKYYELSLSYLEAFRSDTVALQFTIQQGMRTEYLQGITDVGLQIIKHNGKE
ncbi:MAG: gliding motility lipoprotein GldH [Paludibacteraceae bacterium]|nr:gliding motility lipoprotein GldH [Paludibacteraceae bacterium]